MTSPLGDLDRERDLEGDFGLSGSFGGEGDVDRDRERDLASRTTEFCSIVE